MGFNGINHLAMATGDMDKTIRFWRDLLGMRLVAGLGEPGYRHYFFQTSAIDLITFFEWTGVKPVPPSSFHTTFPVLILDEIPRCGISLRHR
jgi:catechol 2,3-dioxygenase-like lactoylglutathione lyase family enzyme